MYPLSDILQHSSRDYMLYISRKTNFIIRSNDSNQLRWFWQHIIKNYDYQKFMDGLDAEEKKIFCNFLSSFCSSRSIESDKEISKIEKKSVWIFKHPMGGFYIPVEFIKVLMNEKSLFKEGFLFTLLYRLRLKEQKNLTALIKGYYDVFQTMTSEQNAWDMGLVIYMLFANFHTSGIHQRKIESNPKLLSMHAQTFQNDRYQKPLLRKATPIWKYLYSQFSHFCPALDEWQSIMKHGKKGFYRSLSLVSQPKEELVYLFASGYFMPIFPKNLNKIEDIQLVTPVEIICEQNSVLARNKLING